MGELLKSSAETPPDRIASFAERARKLRELTGIKRGQTLLHEREYDETGRLRSRTERPSAERTAPGVKHREGERVDERLIQQQQIEDQLLRGETIDYSRVARRTLLSTEISSDRLYAEYMFMEPWRLADRERLHTLTVNANLKATVIEYEQALVDDLLSTVEDYVEHARKYPLVRGRMSKEMLEKERMVEELLINLERIIPKVTFINNLEFLVGVMEEDEMRKILDDVLKERRYEKMTLDEYLKQPEHKDASSEQKKRMQRLRDLVPPELQATLSLTALRQQYRRLEDFATEKKIDRKELETRVASLRAEGTQLGYIKGKEGEYAVGLQLLQNQSERELRDQFLVAGDSPKARLKRPARVANTLYVDILNTHSQVILEDALKEGKYANVENAIRTFEDVMGKMMMQYHRSELDFSANLISLLATRRHFGPGSRPREIPDAMPDWQKSWLANSSLPDPLKNELLVEWERFGFGLEDYIDIVTQAAEEYEGYLNSFKKQLVDWIETQLAMMNEVLSFIVSVAEYGSFIPEKTYFFPLLRKAGVPLPKARTHQEFEDTKKMLEGHLGHLNALKKIAEDFRTDTSMASMKETVRHLSALIKFAPSEDLATTSGTDKNDPFLKDPERGKFLKVIPEPEKVDDAFLKNLDREYTNAKNLCEAAKKAVAKNNTPENRELLKSATEVFEDVKRKALGCSNFLIKQLHDRDVAGVHENVSGFMNSLGNEFQFSALKFHRYGFLKDAAYMSVVGPIGTYLEFQGVRLGLHVSGRAVSAIRWLGRAGELTGKALRGMGRMVGWGPRAIHASARKAASGVRALSQTKAGQTLLRQRTLGVTEKIAETRVGQFLSRLNVLAKLRATRVGGLLSKAAGGSLRIVGPAASGAITWLELQFIEEEMRAAEGNPALQETIANQWWDKVKEGAAFAATFLLGGPGVPLTGPIWYASNLENGRAEVKKSWDRSLEDWLQFSPPALLQGVADASTANVIESDGGGTLPTIFSREKGWFELPQWGSWKGSRLFELMGVDSSAEQERAVAEIIAPAAQSTRGRIVEAYIRHNLFLPLGAKDQEKNRAAQLRTMFLSGITQGTFEKPGAMQFQMADAFAELVERRQALRDAGEPLALQYATDDGKIQFLDLRELLPTEGKRTSREWSSHALKCVNVYMQYIRPAEELLLFNTMGQAAGDQKQFDVGTRQMANAYTNVRQSILTRLIHSVHDAERAISVLDLPGLDVPVIGEEETARNVLRAYLAARIQKKVDDITWNVLEGNFSEEQYDAAQRSIDAVLAEVRGIAAQYEAAVNSSVNPASAERRAAQERVDAFYAKAQKELGPLGLATAKGLLEEGKPHPLYALYSPATMPDQEKDELHRKAGMLYGRMSGKDPAKLKEEGDKAIETIREQRQKALETVAGMSEPERMFRAGMQVGELTQIGRSLWGIRLREGEEHHFYLIRRDPLSGILTSRKIVLREGGKDSVEEMLKMLRTLEAMRITGPKNPERKLTEKEVTFARDVAQQFEHMPEEPVPEFLRKQFNLNDRIPPTQFGAKGLPGAEEYTKPAGKILFEKGVRFANADQAAQAILALERLLERVEKNSLAQAMDVQTSVVGKILAATANRQSAHAATLQAVRDEAKALGINEQDLLKP